MSRPLVEDAIHDILLRLRVKDLLRFRCLSKSLCAKIDSPAFVNAHHHRSVETKTRQRVGVFLGNEGYRGIDLDDDIHRFIELNKPYDCRYSMLCSCNGLILFGNGGDGSLVLWNPFTRKSKKLAPTPYRPQAYIGLGYDSATNDYKVINLYLSEVTIFDVATDTWSEVATKTTFRNPLSRVGVFANGALHWLSGNDDEVNDEYVYSFDISQKKFVKILPTNPPQSSSLAKFYPSSLQVLRGHLVLGVDNCTKTLELYEAVVDKRDGKRSIWIKLYTIDLMKLKRFNETVPKSGMVDLRMVSRFKFLEFSKDGKKILLQHYTNLCWYDLQCQTYQPVALQYGCHICFESLYSFCTE